MLGPGDPRYEEAVIHSPNGNPAAREEIRRITGFRLELGVPGLRLDAAPFLSMRGFLWLRAAGLPS